MTLGAIPLILGASSLVWGASQWLTIAAPVVAILVLVLLWSYWRGRANRGVRIAAAALKIAGILILALCLLEPLFSGTRAKPGANLFIVLADNSRSMTLHDKGAPQSRADQLRAITAKPSKWLSRIAQDFDLRQYAFDTQLRTQAEFDSIAFDGDGSNLGATLDRLMRQYQGRPVAGILVLTDGSATDADRVEGLLDAGSASGVNHPGTKGAQDRVTEVTQPVGARGDSGSASSHPVAQSLPPIYPVMLGRQSPAGDVNLQQISVTQTNFEDAPVTLSAQITTSGFSGKSIQVQLVDESGKQIEVQKLRVDADGTPITVRFRFRPDQPGVSFYRVRAASDGKLAELDSIDTQPSAATTRSTRLTLAQSSSPPSDEATLANNTRLISVDRAKGPYRVLYVCGRPNWEYKFLQRAIQPDDQVQLVGLLRIARREPKFNYISHAGERSNPLFRGFEGTDKEQVEEYDQPVLIRIGTADQEELRGGFPKTAEELFKYHAIILDDLESEFFSQDQMLLLKDFVRQRGGGLLMLGGQESFKNGKYDRTPIGDLLPVYVDEVPMHTPDAKFRMSLTREGWLEPWVRLRGEEDQERKRLDAMPPFVTLNAIRGIKPGASVLASATADGINTVPALVEQRFGRGRAGALLIGDLWRWGLRRQPDDQDDLPKAWRQTVRWLVSDVPNRVEVAIVPRREVDDANGAITLAVRVRDEKYAPQDNAAVTIRITTPDGKTVDLPADPSAREAGLYKAMYVPRQRGAFRAAITAASPDGNEIAQVQAGWASDPSADEFRDLSPNAALLQRLAGATKGQVIPPDDLDKFAASLPTRHAEITEPDIRPVWHQPWVLAVAIACLCGEWGLRRWKGLP